MYTSSPTKSPTSQPTPKPTNNPTVTEPISCMKYYQMYWC